MDFSAVMNLVLGGGLVATIIAIITLKSTVREARAKAEKATAEAETVRIDNTEHATRKEQDNHHDACNCWQYQWLSGGVPFHAGSPAKLSCFHSVPLLRVLQYSRSGYGLCPVAHRTVCG